MATRFNWVEWLASCNNFNIDFHLDMASEQGQVTVAVTSWCAFKTNNSKSFICNYSGFELIMVMCPTGWQTVQQVHPPICNGNCQLACAMPPNNNNNNRNGEHPQGAKGCLWWALPQDKRIAMPEAAWDTSSWSWFQCLLNCSQNSSFSSNLPYLTSLKFLSSTSNFNTQYFVKNHQIFIRYNSFFSLLF